MNMTKTREDRSTNFQVASSRQRTRRGPRKMNAAAIDPKTDIRYRFQVDLNPSDPRRSCRCHTHPACIVCGLKRLKLGVVMTVNSYSGHTARNRIDLHHVYPNRHAHSFMIPRLTPCHLVSFRLHHVSIHSPPLLSLPPFSSRPLLSPRRPPPKPP